MRDTVFFLRRRRSHQRHTGMQHAAADDCSPALVAWLVLATMLRGTDAATSAGLTAKDTKALCGQQSAVTLAGNIAAEQSAQLMALATKMRGSPATNRAAARTALGQKETLNLTLAEKGNAMTATSSRLGGAAASPSLRDGKLASWLLTLAGISTGSTRRDGKPCLSGGETKTQGNNVNTNAH
ncbi:hypothetical protein TRVL_04983 [Trypanosoma vivax]|nr:hypothetical protein TRVL_04983 [Trypanosoma vivax]